ncbi:MAG: c-type cytochrome [Candidatus Methylomirabilales bacterium]
MPRIPRGLALMTLTLLVWSNHPQAVYAAGGHQHKMSPMLQEEKSHAPVKTTMEELHHMGGVPPGWKFNIPEGDADAGRKVYIEMKCYTCHQIAGEKFPKVDPEERKPGPDLTGMGAHHPRDYFAEAVLNPNAVILTDKPGFLGKDGLSIMPDYNDTLSIKQWIDLATYLKSLRGGMKHEMKQTTGHGQKK